LGRVEEHIDPLSHEGLDLIGPCHRGFQLLHRRDGNGAIFHEPSEHGSEMPKVSGDGGRAGFLLQPVVSPPAFIILMILMPVGEVGEKGPKLGGSTGGSFFLPKEPEELVHEDAPQDEGVRRKLANLAVEEPVFS
jgi:hypothetical protein